MSRKGDQLADLDFEVGQAGVEQAADVFTGCFSPVADVEDLADLGELQPGGLSSVDEVDPSDCVRDVVAVAARRALRGRQEPLVTSPTPVRLTRALRSGIALTIGFAGTLMAAGLLISAGARGLVQAAPWLGLAIGVVLVLLGLAMLAGRSLSLRLPARPAGPQTAATPSAGPSPTASDTPSPPASALRRLRRRFGRPCCCSWRSPPRQRAPLSPGGSA